MKEDSYLHVQEFYPMYFNFFLAWNEVKQHQYLSNEM